MLQEEIEEQLRELTCEVEERSAEAKELKENRNDEPMLISRAEYDFVTSVPEKVIGTFFTAHINGIRIADCTLALTDEEWRLHTVPDKTNRTSTPCTHP